MIMSPPPEAPHAAAPATPGAARRPRPGGAALVAVPVTTTVIVQRRRDWTKARGLAHVSPRLRRDTDRVLTFRARAGGTWELASLATGAGAPLDIEAERALAVLGGPSEGWWDVVDVLAECPHLDPLDAVTAAVDPRSVRPLLRERFPKGRPGPLDLTGTSALEVTTLATVLFEMGDRVPAAALPDRYVKSVVDDLADGTAAADVESLAQLVNEGGHVTGRLPGEVVLRLADHPSPVVRAAVAARDPRTVARPDGWDLRSWEVGYRRRVARLAQDPDERVRLAVATADAGWATAGTGPPASTSRGTGFPGAAGAGPFTAALATDPILVVRTAAAARIMAAPGATVPGGQANRLAVSLFTHPDASVRTTALSAAVGTFDIATEEGRHGLRWVTALAGEEQWALAGDVAALHLALALRRNATVLPRDLRAAVGQDPAGAAVATSLASHRSPLVRVLAVADPHAPDDAARAFLAAPAPPAADTKPAEHLLGLLAPLKRFVDAVPALDECMAHLDLTVETVEGALPDLGGVTSRGEVVANLHTRFREALDQATPATKLARLATHGAWTVRAATARNPAAHANAIGDRLRTDPDPRVRSAAHAPPRRVI